MKPQREIRDYLRDILDACERIEQFTAGMDFARFAADVKTLPPRPLAGVQPLVDERDDGLGCRQGPSPLLLGVGLERDRGRGKGVRVPRGDVVLIQEPARGNVFGEIRVDLGAPVSQLRDGVHGDRTLALREEEALEGFLACLFRHETRVGVIAVLVKPFGNAEVVLGLAEPAQPRLMARLHR